MRKTLTSLLAAATLVAAVGVPVSDANAQWRGRGGGGVAAGIIGGLAAGAIIGGALATRPAYAYPQYAPVQGYAPYEGYYGAVPASCPGGYWARRPIVNPYGQVVGYSRPRFVCP